MKRTSLRDVDRAFIYHVMFEAGIVPMETPDMDMTRPLKDTSPEEARVLKRKFRKVWRRLVKKQLAAKSTPKSLKDRTKKNLGVGNKTPSRAEKLARKAMVFEEFWRTKVQPMLQDFEKVKRDRPAE